MSASPAPVIHLPDEAATARLGRALASVLHPGDVVALQGDLGAGKSALARAAVREAIGDPDEEVPSPTFTLVQTYQADDATWWHFDLYRLERSDDALELGIDEAFAEGICLVEWPERLGPWLPRRALHIQLAIAETGGRTATVSGGGELPARLLHAFMGETYGNV